MFLFRWENGAPKFKKVIEANEPGVQVSTGELSSDEKKIDVLAGPIGAIRTVGCSVVSTCNLYIVDIPKESIALIAEKVKIFNAYSFIWSTDSSLLDQTKTHFGAPQDTNS